MRLADPLCKPSLVWLCRFKWRWAFLLLWFSPLHRSLNSHSLKPNTHTCNINLVSPIPQIHMFSRLFLHLIYFLYQNIPALLKNSLNDAEPRMLYRKTTVSMICVALKDAVISPPLVFVHYCQRGPNCIKGLINSNYKSVRQELSEGRLRCFETR